MDKQQIVDLTQAYEDMKVDYCTIEENENDNSESLIDNFIDK
jgi:hypothetical protein